MLTARESKRIEVGVRGLLEEFMNDRNIPVQKTVIAITNLIDMILTDEDPDKPEKDLQESITLKKKYVSDTHQVMSLLLDIIGGMLNKAHKSYDETSEKVKKAQEILIGSAHVYTKGETTEEGEKDDQ